MLTFRLRYAKLIPDVISAFKYLAVSEDEKEKKVKEEAVFPADLALNGCPSCAQSSSARSETTLSKCKVVFPCSGNHSFGPPRTETFLWGVCCAATCSFSLHLSSRFGRQTDSSHVSPKIQTSKKKLKS